jgi:hypothetical protein
MSKKLRLKYIVCLILKLKIKFFYFIHKYVYRFCHFLSFFYWILVLFWQCGIILHIKSSYWYYTWSNTNVFIEESESEIIVWCQMSNFSAISRREQVTFWWDDNDDVLFILDLYAEMDLHSASSLKRQSAVKHVPPVHSNTFFWFWVNQSLLLLLRTACLAETHKYQLNISVILWQSDLLVEETRVPRENHWPVAGHWQTLSHNFV